MDIMIFMRLVPCFTTCLRAFAAVTVALMELPTPHGTHRRSWKKISVKTDLVLSLIVPLRSFQWVSMDLTRPYPAI
jgi:hypothetical protein